jgi:uncharacterized protein YuzE
MNTLLSELLPQFTKELRAALSVAGEVKLADQVSGLIVYKCTYDTSCDAGYIYVQAANSLNIVEQNIIGIRHGRTVPVEHACGVYLDADNFDRITGIELLEPSLYAQQLVAHSDG